MARAMVAVDSEIERKAQQILARRGYTLEEAVDIFLRRVVEEQDIPLELRTPSPTTKEALRELDRGEGQRFSDLDAFFQDLRA